MGTCDLSVTSQMEDLWQRWNGKIKLAFMSVRRNSDANNNNRTSNKTLSRLKYFTKGKQVHLSSYNKKTIETPKHILIKKNS